MRILPLIPVLFAAACLLARAAEPELTQDEARLLKQAQAAGDSAAAADVLRQGMAGGAGPGLWFALGTFFAQADRIDDAIDANRQALKAMPAFTRARYNLALLLLKRHDYPDAADELRLLLDDPNQSARQIWPLLGYVCSRANQPLAAEEAYRRALVYDPANGDWRRGLADALLAQDRLPEAARLAATELQHEPYHPTWWLILVQRDLAAGDRLAAIARLECLRRLGLADRDSLASLGDLLAREELPADALRVYESCAALDAPPVDRLLRAAEAMTATGHPADAETLLRKLDASSGLTADQQFRRDLLLAGAARRQDRLDDALERWRALESQRPTDATLLMALGDLHRDLQQPAEALPYYQRAARADAAIRPAALARQARLAVDAGDLPAAIALLQEAIHLAPEPYLERYLERLRRLAP